MSSFLTRLKITLGKANADAEALELMRTDENVIVTEGKDISFTPVGAAPDLGVVLYPGGRCDPRAYAPLAHALAAQGHKVVIPNMPLRLAILDANRAAAIIDAAPDVSRWVIAGHSMGGVMANAYAYKHQDSVAGLFLLGSYPAAMHAMPQAELPVLMCTGSRDFITRRSEVEAAPERLPAHTEFVEIAGGDHYQFGSFANAEHSASISREQQHEQTLAAVTGFLSRISQAG